MCRLCRPGRDDACTQDASVTIVSADGTLKPEPFTPAAAAARDARFAAGASLFDFPQPQLGPGFRAEAAAPVGMIFPQPRLADGRLMDDAIGPRFAIVGETPLLESVKPDAVPLPDVGKDWLKQHGVRAALLRPDRYVFDVAR